MWCILNDSSDIYPLHGSFYSECVVTLSVCFHHNSELNSCFIHTCTKQLLHIQPGNCCCHLSVLFADCSVDVYVLFSLKVLNIQAHKPVS